MPGSHPPGPHDHGRGGGDGDLPGGDYQAAEASHTRALQLYRDLDDRSGAAATVCPARSASWPPPARLDQAADSVLGLANARTNRAELLALTSPAEAIPEVGRAIEVQGEISAHHELGKAYTALAVAHLRRGELDFRRARWPHTANPHLLISKRSALGTEPLWSGQPVSVKLAAPDPHGAAGQPDRRGAGAAAPPPVQHLR